MELGDDYELILDYFEETYIGCIRRNNIRRKPLFSIAFWNMYNRTTQASIRTNNSAEAYHRRIGSVFQCAHPTLWVFLQKLLDEEHAVHANILQIKAGQPQKQNKNIRFEQRLLNVISNPHADILAQINAIAYNISL
ncbi:unnamed protein product [Rotaria sordida]|nr:unnamed protein product [Rotaria sordida]CAF1647376.1 unnamed protein product [Rotaria sordida]